MPDPASPTTNLLRQVEEIHLNYTRFLDKDNGRVWWPNRVLRDTPFINLSASGGWADRAGGAVPASCSVAVVHARCRRVWTLGILPGCRNSRLVRHLGWPALVALGPCTAPAAPCFAPLTHTQLLLCPFSAAFSPSLLVPRRSYTALHSLLPPSLPASCPRPDGGQLPPAAGPGPGGAAPRPAAHGAPRRARGAPAGRGALRLLAGGALHLRAGLSRQPELAARRGGCMPSTTGRATASRHPPNRRL